MCCFSPTLSACFVSLLSQVCHQCLTVQFFPHNLLSVFQHLKLSSRSLFIIIFRLLWPLSLWILSLSLSHPISSSHVLSSFHPVSCLSSDSLWHAYVRQMVEKSISTALHRLYTVSTASWRHCCRGKGSAALLWFKALCVTSAQVV